jgi:hypothetical protein
LLQLKANFLDYKMGISVKWTFENESIFYAGEPFIIYLTFSCTADEKKPVPMAPQVSFLSTVMGMFSPSSSLSTTSSPPATKKLTVEAENSRKKSLMFVPKSQKLSYKSTKLPELDQEEVIQGETVKIQLSNSNDVLADSDRFQTTATNGTGTPIHSMTNGKHKREIPPVLRPSSAAVFPSETESKGQAERPPNQRKSSVSNVSSEAESEENVTLQGVQEIAWIFTQMTGNFIVDVGKKIKSRIQLLKWIKLDLWKIKLHIE